MPPSKRSRRPADDMEDLDQPDTDVSRQAGQEKIKLLIVDLIGRWHWIAFGLVVGVLGGFYYLAKAPRLYEASSALLIKQQTSSVMSGRGGGDNVEEMDLRSLEALNTVAQRIARPELLQKVASRPELRAMPGLMPRPVNWLPDWSLRWFGKSKAEIAGSQAPPPPTALAASISGWIKITVRRNTRLLDVTVTHPSPEVCKALADAIGVEYQAELTGAHSSNRRSSLQILLEQSEAARGRLQTAQNAIAIYQRALSTLKDLETREATYAELSRRYLPKHPRMVTAKDELTTCQQHFLSEFDAARNSTADRSYWDSHDEEWKKAGDNEEAKLLTARRLLLARGNVLESEISSQTGVFNSMLTRIQESDINNQAAESEMEISSAAQLPSVPVAPVASKVLAITTAGGLFIGLLLALTFVRIDNKIHTVFQLEGIAGLPVLAAITDVHVKAIAEASRDNEDKIAAAFSAARQRWEPMLLFREGVSSSTFAEMFRVLRVAVSLLGDEKKRRITLFSSGLPGEGKTFVSSNFALAAAQQGKRVLLIDLDLRKPAVHKMFGLERESHPNGVTEVLSGQVKFEDGIYTDTGDPHLHVMLAGKRSPNPGELLNSSSLEEFLGQAAAAYDLVVIDSAPVLAVPDTRIIAPLVDNFCLVVRANFVSKGAVRHVLDLLEHDHDLPSGLVFNGFSEKRRLVGQNYSYGNYQSNKYGQAYRYGYGRTYGTYGSGDREK